MSNLVAIGPENWEIPPFDSRERAVLKTVELQTRHFFGDILERPSIYEIIWLDKSSKITPSFSIIPFSTKHQSNLTVLQRLYLKNSFSPIYLMHKAFTPNDDDIIFSGVQAGVILDYPVDRGFYFRDTLAFRGPAFEAVPLSNIDDPDDLTSMMNPLLALIQSETRNSGFLDDKKSYLVGRYHTFKDQEETPQFGLTKYKAKSPKGFVVAPYGSKTIIFASTCACSSVWDKHLDKGRIKEQVEWLGKRMKLTIAPAGTGGMAQTTSVVNAAIKLTDQVKAQKEVTSMPPINLGQNFFFLLLEAHRRQIEDSKRELSLYEMFGMSPKARMDTIMKGITMDLFKDYEKQ